MAYDEQLADEVRAVIAPRSGYDEIKMFGGLCFLVNTHMVVGVTDRGLLLKVGAAEVDAAVARGATRAFMGEMEMKGMARVPHETLARDGVGAWVLPGVEAALALPPKPPKKPKPPKRPKAAKPPKPSPAQA